MLIYIYIYIFFFFFFFFFYSKSIEKELWCISSHCFFDKRKLFMALNSYWIVWFLTSGVQSLTPYLIGYLSPGSCPRWKMSGCMVCSSCVCVVTPGTSWPGQKFIPCLENKVRTLIFLLKQPPDWSHDLLEMNKQLKLTKTKTNSIKRMRWVTWQGDHSKHSRVNVL